MKFNIGIINPDIYALLFKSLTNSGYHVYMKHNNNINIHLWILDKVNQDLFPCFVVALKDTENEIIAALLQGAEDCCSNKYINEIIVRVDRIITKLYPVNTYYCINDYEIDLNKKMIHNKNKLIKLTNNEFIIIEYLIKNRNIAVERDTLLKVVWGNDYYGSSRVVDDTLRRIRKKLPKLNIRMIYGFGYRLD